MKRQPLFLAMHAAMRDALGPGRWWPDASPFEIAVGSILTQNVSWENVERAMANLKAGGEFTAEALLALPVEELARLIRPVRYFQVKAARLRNLLALIVHDLGGDLTALARMDLETARQTLLAVRGVGPETADKILLFALGLPSFVVDAYTVRVCGRHALLAEDAGYGEVREMFMDALPEDPALFAEYHELLARVGNAWCKPKAPRCATCPLAAFLP
ncbi:HhH-GPD family protein [Solidesulfovibrio carbinoliphilus subsp. oakridgensis]|uniref:HhH-GPD family protein n=1 Tax=Solidesulfovibrio carbinoliphilus subsp. oakridgensis TaxID=694327 RepID=G7QCX1_9BACT|nr:endonuclease [Solidesulfovibrio carbinoliphilus]EHJ46277.1 HhH-GPD family protein [Solidesulfovibrio carbinoliphilus subsp. oakridgensis]